MIILSWLKNKCSHLSGGNGYDILRVFGLITPVSFIKKKLYACMPSNLVLFFMIIYNDYLASPIILIKRVSSFDWVSIYGFRYAKYQKMNLKTDFSLGFDIE